MTNGDKMRSLGDSSLLDLIRENFRDIKKCSVCAVGIDKKGMCKDATRDCEEAIYEWLGQEAK